jgi:hypothetical protein
MAAAWLCLGLSLAVKHAQAIGGTTGADVLQARLGARPIGMGGAYAALGDDLAVTFYNPAGLSQVKGPELSFLHFSAIAEISYENFAYAHPLSFGVLGANLLVRNQPDINNTLAQDNPVSASDLVFSLTYAGKVSYFFDSINERLRNITFGINAKYLHSHLGQYDASAFAADLGARYPVDESLTLGLSVLNLGTPVKFINVSDPLPSALLGGVAKRFDLGKSNVFNAAADVEYPMEGDIRLRVGGEDWLGKSLALRVGYVLEANENFGGLTAGLSVRLDQESLFFSFDYAFQPVYYSGFNSFEPQHLFSMSLGF